jgi:hypothetical protein
MSASGVHAIRRGSSGLAPRSGVAPPAALYPKEHGAYAILGIPLAAALVIGGTGVVALLTALAAVAGFVAHEPLMVSLGRRGQRAQSATPHAKRRLVLLVLVAVGSGTLAFWWAPLNVRMALAACLLFAGAACGMSVAKLHRTLAAQLIDIMSLTIPGAVILMAEGAPAGLAFRFWLAWVVGRIATTTAVHSTIAGQKASTQGRIPPINEGLVAGSILCGVVGLVLGLSEWIAITPLLGAAVYLRCRPPLRTQMRQTGWVLLAVNVVSALWMISLWSSRGGMMG